MRDSNASAFALVDGHVHVHPCFASDDFLDAAFRNFQKAAMDLGRTAPFSACLLLTETRDAGWFRRSREVSDTKGRWTFLSTGEESSLWALNPAQSPTGERLLLIAGRQIATREGLEVLALGHDLDVPDGLPLDEVLDRVRESGALPVLPWGFGKWWGSRGARVDAALRERQGLELFLGDNAGRLGVAGPPRLFREARERGVPVLPGSDPLPFPRHAGRAGSYGFVLEGALDERRPAESLLARIRGLDGPPRVFGRCAGPLQFLRDQVAMQWRRRSAASPRVATVS